MQLPSDKTRPTFEKKGTRPEGMSTLTETSYLVAQLRPSRDRKQEKNPGRERKDGLEKGDGKRGSSDANQTRARKVEWVKDKKKREKSQKTIERERESEAQAPKNKDVEQTEGASKLTRAHIRKARTKARHPRKQERKRKKEKERERKRKKEKERERKRKKEKERERKKKIK